MERILVTGANGFCARHLIARLSARTTSRVYGVDIQPTPAAGRTLAGYRMIDLTDAPALDALLEELEPDVLFHLAGRHRGAPHEIYRANFLGSLHVLEGVRRIAPKARVLLVGSAAEYGRVPREALPVSEGHPCRPVSAYGISKFAATLMAQDYAARYGVRVAIARPFNIVGAGLSDDLVIGAVLQRIRSAMAAPGFDGCIPVGRLDSERDFLAVDDVVDALLAMTEASGRGEVYNICSGTPRTVLSVLEELVRFAPLPIRWKIDPALVNAAEVPCMFGSYAKAQAAFGFAPRRPLAEALESAWRAAMESVPPCA